MNRMRDEDCAVGVKNWTGLIAEGNLLETSSWITCALLSGVKKSRFSAPRSLLLVDKVAVRKVEAGAVVVRTVNLVGRRDQILMKMAAVALHGRNCLRLPQHLQSEHNKPTASSTGTRAAAVVW